MITHHLITVGFIVLAVWLGTLVVMSPLSLLHPLNALRLGLYMVTIDAALKHLHR